MATARASRTIHASPDDLWRVVSDPYHLPRWWPRVERVEDVGDGAFTEVMRTRAGKTVRADFDLLRADPASRLVLWQQRLEGTPFAGVLSQSETELRIEPAAPDVPSARAGAQASEVTIEMRQELSGRASQSILAGRDAPSPRPRRRPPSLGGWMLRRAAARTIAEALDGLERISA
jgi:uncharacterized protein YndB with AHSA1/START domain